MLLFYPCVRYTALFTRFAEVKGRFGENRLPYMVQTYAKGETIVNVVLNMGVFNSYSILRMRRPGVPLEIAQNRSKSLEKCLENPLLSSSCVTFLPCVRCTALFTRFC